ncbi:disabled homolog 2-interacting protein-like isoform X2 [Stylophora pistillata]|uniref:disabled homolog 2-interacting protein-like isoform X2 n=1 Tax=Stylophora pistillata TaxID=50429 RepID=UPI000C04BBEB|nr:disabled homolog 2-interacting protein-like isoform X2 [Stylophora pistillata]
MISETLEGWLTILAEDGSEWLSRLCVLFANEKKLRSFIDDIEYLDCARFLAATAKIKAKLCDNSDLILNPTHEGLSRAHRLSRRSRSENALSAALNGNRSKLSDFFTKKITDGKRHRSLTRSLFLPGTNNSDSGFSSLSPPTIPRWRSQETLDSKMKTTSSESVDLSISGHVTVRPIHPSILSRQHCFQVTTPHETKYFSCRSSQELEKWVVSIKKSIQPTRDVQYRTDIGLTVWIVEAKGLTDKPKRRFYCELFFDKVLYAKTSSKTKSDILFWGENFAFNDLPEVKTVTVQIYKETDGKNKKDKRKPVGSVDVPVDSLEIGVEVEKWYPVTMESNKTNGGESSSVRLRFKYQKVSILPVKSYSELLEYLNRNYMTICKALEPVVSVKQKDEISRVLLKILQACGKATEFLSTIVMDEVNNLEDENLVFRGNSFATKAMDSYMKMIGESYLQDTLGDFVQSVYEFEEDCEVDPSKKSSGNLESNKENLKNFVEKAWNLIMCSACLFPSDLQITFHEFRRWCEGRSEDLSTKLISGSIFLRFLCPAILSPSLFHLVQEYPNERTSRALTLIAKVVQNLANFTRFGGKEEYMGFMNGFVEKEFVNMRKFLSEISSRTDTTENNYEGIIDIGRELALMFNMLKDQTSKMNQDALETLRPLQFILKSLQETYHDSERKFALGNESLVAHRKWASSSDLVSDQDKNNITLTPVSQIRIMKSPNKRTQSPPITSSSESNLVDTGSTTAAIPEHLTISRYDESILSPISDIDPPNLSPRLRATYDDNLQSSLRRRSYRRAIASDEVSTAIPGAIERERSSSERRSLTRNLDSHRRSQSESPHVISSMDGGSPNEARVIYQGELSNSRSSLKSKEGANHRHYRAVHDSRQRNGKEGSLKRRSLPPGNSPVITDRSRTSSPEHPAPPRPTAPKPKSVESPRSSPHPNNNDSSRFLNPTVGRVARSPSGTSSSSSGSEESWHSVGSSVEGVGGGGGLSRRRARKMPRTPSPEDTSRGSSSPWERMPPRAEDTFENGYDVPPPKTIAEYEKELQDLREELLQTKRTLASTHEQLILQESSTHKLVASFKERLAESESSLQQLRHEKDKEMKELLDRLVSVETELRQEHKEMQEVIQAKQVIIEAQERRIKSIDSNNAKLIATLNQVGGSRANNKVLNYPSSDL